MKLPACADWEPPVEGTSHENWNPDLCAFCGRRTDRSVLDHDHATGFERGYICRRCNRMESIAWHESHVLYPAWSAWRAGCNPASLLGQDLPYDGWGWQGGVNVLEAYYDRQRDDDSDQEALMRALDGLFIKT